MQGLNLQDMSLPPVLGPHLGVTAVSIRVPGPGLQGTSILYHPHSEETVVSQFPPLHLRDPMRSGYPNHEELSPLFIGYLVSKPFTINSLSAPLLRKSFF